jgi:hypothetical protein
MKKMHLSRRIKDEYFREFDEENAFINGEER